MMNIKHRNNNRCKFFKQGICAVLFILAINGCKKDNQIVKTPDAGSGSTIDFVLNDNFSLNVVYAGLQYAGLIDTLAKPGPYTFLASDNNAFLMEGVTQYGFYYFGSVGRVQNIMRYCILNGNISFKSLPLVQNKPFLTHGGGNVYVTKYLNGSDTIVTVNGLILSSIDNRASNGLIQVLPQVMNPEIYQKLVDHIHNDTTLTMFSAALQRCKLDVSLLSGSDEYTLLAPSNTAFYKSGQLGKDLGISTLDSILTADPVKLTAFLKYHIIKGRYFEGDLYRNMQADPTGIVMLDGGKVVIGGYPSGFHAITFLGSGNNGIPSQIPTPVFYDGTINYADIPCGNGVIHIINQVLIP
ncbi:fasciclin domain-containing protein [Mucilaginibacter mallensis]|nr:fasciclin domain-containing protein [Mucilaginibacter mallensis]